MIFRMKGAIHHLELTAPANSSLELAAGSCELITTPTHESALIHDELDGMASAKREVKGPASADLTGNDEAKLDGG